MSNATAISDIERAEHLNYAEGKGVKRVSVYNDGTQVNVATEEKQDAIIAALGGGDYATVIRSSGSYIYIGKAAIGSSLASAVWQVKRLDTTTLLDVKWADGDASFNNVFNNYASLTYL